MRYPKERLNKKAYIYGVIFSLANRLQNDGDSRCEEVTTKQWFTMANIALMEDYSMNLKQLAKIIGTSSRTQRSW